MGPRGHRKQVLLFLIAVVLPSFVLVLLTWRMISQQRELDEKRLADERRRIAAEIGQKLLVRLEKIKVREVSATASGAQSLSAREYPSPEVVVTCLADGRRLLLPWEAEQRADTLGHALSEVEFSEKIRLAEQDEFRREEYASAHKLYLECIETAQHPAQEAYARLSLARVLAKSDRASESLAEYHKLAAVSPAITDEHGVPLCLYAAGRLVEAGQAYGKVLELIRTELRMQRWLGPIESYMLRDLAKTLLESDPELPVRHAAGDCQQGILKHIRVLEQVLALQKDFPHLASLVRRRSSSEEREPRWLPHGEEPWLVSLAPPLPEKRPLLVVVRGAHILDSITGNTVVSETGLGNVEFLTGAGSEGESLGTSFPGLRVTFATDGAAVLSSHWGLQRSVYLVALCLVLCVTLFGAYLLWRDVGRELRMAELRSQFVSSVSHELKTPLTAIRMFAETLRLGRPKASQARDEYLETIVNESQRLTRLLNNVLDFSNIEKGKRTYRKELASLSNIIHAAVRATRYPLTQQGFQLNVQLEDDLPEVRVDRDAIEQAILNLLTNAMKYSGESREIDLRLQTRHGQAVIEVSDQGVGIEPAEQKRIFDKFYRVPGGENECIPGTGLGLALVSHIVKAHEGRVEVRSLAGEGSTFSIYLPLRINDEPDSHHRG